MANVMATQYIDITPEFSEGRFWARVRMSDYEIAGRLEIVITARRSDGLYEKRTVTYPSEDAFFVDADLMVDMFALRVGEYGQIVSVRINGEPVYIQFGTLEGIAGMMFRYSDSVVRNELDLIGNVVLDFQVLPSYDPKVIMIADNSQWGGMSRFEATLKIIPPGYDSPKTIYWQKDRINVLNSFVLELSCVENCEPTFVDLPDGVYSLTLTAADGTERQRQYLKTDLLRLKIDGLYIDNALTCRDVDKQKMSKIRMAEFYLKAAEANIRLGRMIEANELYCLAQKMVEGC
jgi:hypothetical protein